MASYLTDTESKRKNSIRLQNALRPLPITCDLLIDYSDRESSVSSDLHDPFTDDEDEDDDIDNANENDKIDDNQSRKSETDDNLRLEYLKRRLSKSQIASNLTSYFTPEHHKAELSTRLMMNVTEADYCTENLREFHVYPMQIDKSNDFEENAVALIKSVNLQEHAKGKQIAKKSIDKKEKYQPQRTDSRRAHIDAPLKILKATRLLGGSALSDPSEKIYETIDANALSGVWRMLKGNPKEREFRITEEGYNIFNDRHFDWMTRKETGWTEQENIRSKCETWFQKKG